MSSRAYGTSFRRARIHARRTALAASVAVALTVGAIPAAAAPSDTDGVGQQLQLNRTYNSMDASWGRISPESDE